MRIGIVTLPLHSNFGGILQAYALQTKLQSMGHSVSVISSPYKPLRMPFWKAPVKYASRLFRKYVSGDTSVVIDRERRYNREEPLKRKNPRLFIERYISLLETDSLDSLKENDFDALIVGSDQVWRPRYFSPVEDAFLDFAESWDVKRMAYAASFGTERWEFSQSQTDKCSRLLKKFDYVSVREESAVRMCSEHLSVIPEHVLDPTLLLEASDYEILADTSDKRTFSPLITYILDEDQTKRAIIDEISRSKGLSAEELNIFGKGTPPARCTLTVEQWLKAFINAEMIITDSFHGCVFSILFSKPFFVLANKSRGMGRISSLLKMFDLQDRLIESIDDYYKRDFEDELGNDVKEALDSYRSSSIGFLSKIQK